MPTILDTAICIRRWDFSETSQTVSLFTREHGVIRGLAKGSKRSQGAFSGGIDVLTRGQIGAIIKPGRELATLTSWSLDELYRHLRADLQANRAALYMADVVNHMVIDHDPHPALFRALENGLIGLNVRGNEALVLVRFQLALLTETGYRPQLERDARTGHPLPRGDAALAFDPQAGGVVAAGGDRSPWRVRHETIELLRRQAAIVDQVAPSESLPHESEAALGRANRLLAAYLRELIGEEPAAMRWAFSDL